MKTLLASAAALTLLASPVMAQNVSAPTGQVYSQGLPGSGLGSSVLVPALIGGAALVGIIAIAASDDDDDFVAPVTR